MANRHRRSEIERLLARRRRNGLTFRELSEESGIPIPTLSWWSRKLSLESEETDSEELQDLVEVEVLDDSTTPGVEDAIEMRLGGDVRIRVPASVTESHLRRVLRAVTPC